MSHKIPVSVLVVIYTPALEVLLLERVDPPGFWQSVTGSRETPEEPLRETACREVREETGIRAEDHVLVDWHVQNEFEIYTRWRHRYPPGVTRNVEHVFGVQVREPLPVRLSPSEHRDYQWLPWRAAAEKCFSWSNREAIATLPDRVV